MSPNSTAGQIFCVFFALIGIPLNMVVLNRVGKYMLVIERNISNFLEEKMGKMVRTSNSLLIQILLRSFQLIPNLGKLPLSNIDHIFFPFLCLCHLQRCTCLFVHVVSSLSGVALFFVVPMIIFQQQEGWTYSQAIYYCFITLSTIGFGDFVAGII